MSTNPLLGTGVFLLGGLAASLYLLPFRAVRGWKYETGWLVCVLAGWLVYPFVIAQLTVPDVWAVIATDGGGTILRTMAFGALWSIGALCWALMVRYLGIGLGLAIGAGLCAATGTLLPPLVTGHADELVATRGACVVLAGVLLSFIGIALVGAAGRLKEGEMSEEAKKKAVAEYNFKKGVITAVIAGVASGGINFGLQGAPHWEEVALAQGASSIWAGMPVLMVTLWGGVLVQILYTFVRQFHDRSFGDYVRFAAPREQVTNYLLSILVGLVGVSQFFCQKIGEPLMGEIRYISFAVLMASAIFFSTAAGLVLGEWRGTGLRTRLCLAVGILVLLCSFTIMSLGGSIK